MPVTTIYPSTTNGGVGSHLVWWDDFYRFFNFFTVFVFFFRLFFMFFVFLGYYTTFCLVLFMSLSVFGHEPLRERRDRESPHPSWFVNFEATARFILRFDSSGWLRLLSISKSSRNLSIVSSSRCLRFSKRIIAWCPCTPDPKRFNKTFCRS